jgi:hypothetical protein
MDALQTVVSPLVRPVDTLKQIFLRVFTETETEQRYIFNEFRLCRQPENLKAFVDIFDGINKHPTVWITKNAFVCLREGSTLPRIYQERWFKLALSDKHEHVLYLSIHSSTLEESIICLDYLVGLKDTHFEAMDLSCKDDDDWDYYEYEERDLRLCPFTASILEKMLQNSARPI